MLIAHLLAIGDALSLDIGEVFFLKERSHHDNGPEEIAGPDLIAPDLGELAFDDREIADFCFAAV